MKRLRYLRTIVSASLLFISSLVLSQKFANNWLFESFGLEFKEHTVAIHHDYAECGNRNTATISDESGNLLFYTNGIHIWNKNHTIMPNGKNVLSVGNSQSVIIPKPDSKSIYYVFVAGSYYDNEPSLYFLTVDISLDNGLGDITQTKKIINGVHHLTAVYHENNQDIWVIVHQQDSNKYHSFLVSKTGLTETPVISSMDVAAWGQGQMKASPDGKKIAHAHDRLNTSESFSLFDFNNSTGEITNPLSFSMPAEHRDCSAVEFSSDAKKVFVFQNGSTGECAIYQFDISNDNYEDIKNSRIRIYDPWNNDVAQMQLAPNGKIYFTKGGGQHSGTEYLGIIENPNERGSNCIVKEHGLYLEGKSVFVVPTPVFIQSYFFKTDFTITNPCCSQLTDFIITNEEKLESVEWDFGVEGGSSTLRNPQFKYNKAGSYTVTLLAHYLDKTDKIQKTITVNPSPIFDLGEDVTVCYGHELGISDEFKSYLWNTGETTPSIIVTESGKYKITVDNGYGCLTSDSVYLNVTEMDIAIPDSIHIQPGTPILVSPGNYKSYLWSTGETTSDIYIEHTGWYSVTVESEAGCTATKLFYAYTGQPSAEPKDSYNWTLLNPQPSALDGLEVYFLDNQIGYILNNNQVIGTQDGGTTWQVMTEITSGKRMKFKDGYGYIIGDYGTIYKSGYMGTGWEKLDIGVTDNLTGISVINKDTVFITGTRNLYVTYDGGKSWHTSAITDNRNNITDSYFINSEVGHVGYANGDVYKTIDGGKTWNLKSSINSSSSNINTIYFISQSIGFISRGYGGGILKTTDAGETWQEINSPHHTMNAIFFSDLENGYIAGEHGVIFKTTNGGTSWKQAGFQNGLIYGTDINGLYFFDNMRGFAIGLGGRIMKTTDGGKTWSQYAFMHTEIRQLMPVSNSIIYALTGNSFIKSIDGGNTWNDETSSVNVGQFDFIDEKTGYCISGNKVYITKDGGKTWSATNNGNALSNEHLHLIDFIDDNTGIVGSNSNIFKTTDGGNTWSKISDNSFGQIQFINSSVGYARNTGNYYNRVYKTTDGGENWSLIFEIDKGIYDFHFLDENNGYLVGGNEVLHKTTDGGATWQEIKSIYGYFVTVRFHTPNVGYIADDYGHVFQTNNGGETWKEVNKHYSTAGIELYKEDVYLYGRMGVVMKKKIEYDPVELMTYETSNIKNTSATLSGNVTSHNGVVENIKFEYGINSFSNTINAQPNSVQPNMSTDVSIAVENLEPQQTYTFRLCATVNGVLCVSESSQFITQSDYIIELGDFVIASNDATVSGFITSNTSNDITNIEFLYSLDGYFFNSKVAANPNIVQGNTRQEVTASLKPLEPETQYYVRLKADCGGKEQFSSWSRSFKTKKTHSILIYKNNIDGNSATFDIQIEANKDNIRNIVLEYGTTREYRNQKEIPNLIEKGNTEYMSVQLTGLEPSAIYFYRIKADMGDETIYSNENMLRIESGSLMIPIEFKQLSESSVVLQALVNSNGNSLDAISFEYGLTEDFEHSVRATPYYTFSDITYLVSSTVNNLTPATKYYARLSATNYNIGKIYSETFTFTLSPTDIHNINDDTGISIYPNPATDFIEIKAARPITKIEIYNSQGKLLLIAENESRINVSQWDKGVYFVRVFIDNDVITKKISKI